jgi:cyclic-di-GMP-binding protein
MQEPRIEPEGDQPIRLDEVAVEDWTDQLPLANTSYSGRAILSALRHLNQSDLNNCNERFRLAERLRPATVLVAEMGMGVDLADLAFPLTAPRKRMINRSFLLALELARAYRQVINSGDFWNEWSMHEHLRAVVIYRSLEAYGLALLRAEESYQTPPPGFWHSIHSLYRCAEDRQLQLERIREVGPDLAGNTIRNVFVQICLFALANCNRHRPGEIRSIYETLGRFSRDAEMIDATSPGMHQARFFVDLESDEGPCRISGRETSDGNLRYLLTQRMVEKASARLGEARTRTLGGLKLNGGLLKRVLKSIGKPSPRQAKRFPGGTEASLVVGLDRLIRELTVRATTSERVRQPQAPSEIPSWNGTLDLSVGEVPAGHWAVDPNTPDVDLPWPDSSLSERLLVEGLDDAGNPGASLTEREKVRFSVVTLNFSVGGHCLRWESRQAEFLRVGELVGIPATEHTWNIGVIRWLRHDRNDALQFGVELIVPEVYPANVALAGFPESRTVGLFAPPNRRLGLGAGLLIRPALFQTGHLLTVESTHLTQSFVVERSLESTPSYQHLSLSEDSGRNPLFS